MKIKFQGRYTTEELKTLITKIIERLEKYGVTETTGTNLYLNLYNESGDEIMIVDNGEEITQMTYQKAKKPVSKEKSAKSQAKTPLKLVK
jgi:hypothetical protein